MASLTFTISYQKNLTDQVFSAVDLKSLYFTGIELKDQFGNPIPQETIDFYIQAAQKEVQDALSVKLTRQCYQEFRDFVYDDWLKWNYVPVTYMVEKALELKGFVNSTLQVDYPEQWLSTKSQSADKDLYHRNIHLVPITGSLNNTISGSATFVGIAPFIGYFNNRVIPNYWRCRFLTGFSKIPADILSIVGKRAAINIFLLLGDLVTGIPGVTSKAISIDGLSQSLGSTNTSSKTGFGARIDAYEREIERQMMSAKMRYVGFIFTAL